MANKKKVSIVVPTYNEEKCLPVCLEALLGVDYPRESFEIIVVDNGSSDNTRKLAKDYGLHVYRDDIKNVSGLRNLGVIHSTGEIIAFVDADCVVSKRWLHESEKYFDDLSVALWGSTPIPPQESTWVQKAWCLVGQKSLNVQDVDWLESMNLFVRKQQFLAAGGFNDSLITCEDVDFSYRMRKYGRIVSDSQIRVIHLGEAATVKEFIKKEVWRGKSNLRGVFSHGLVLKELPSISIPIYFGIFVPGILLTSAIFQGPKWVVLFISLYLLPTAAVLFRLKRRIKNKNIRPVVLFHLLVLLQVYFFARTIAIIKPARCNDKRESIKGIENGHI